MARHNLLGVRGEEAAARFLMFRDYSILEQNWRVGHLEVDIIAQKRGLLIFVEVKLRKNARFAEAMEFVDAKKQERIRQTAELYLAEHETQKQPRFDVIEIYAPEGMQTQNPRIRHLEDAFE